MGFRVLGLLRPVPAFDTRVLVKIPRCNAAMAEQPCKEGPPYCTNYS